MKNWEKGDFKRSFEKWKDKKDKLLSMTFILKRLHVRIGYKRMLALERNQKIKKKKETGEKLIYLCIYAYCMHTGSW